MQRKTDALGKSLGRTTGWTHRLTLGRRGVHLVSRRGVPVASTTPACTRA